MSDPTPRSSDGAAKIQVASDSTSNGASIDGALRVELASDGTAHGATMRVGGSTIASIDELREVFRRERERVTLTGGHFHLVVVATASTPWSAVMKIANLCKLEGLPTEDFEIGVSKPGH